MSSDHLRGLAGSVIRSLNADFLAILKEHLAPAVLPGLIALAVCAALIPGAMWFAPKIGLVSSPTRERDLHVRSTPFLGGLAMFGGFSVASLSFLPRDPILTSVLVLCGASAVVFTLDDRAKLPPLVKLAGQTALAIGAVAGFGFGIDLIYLPILMLPIHLGLLSLPITVLWIVGMKNTVNLLDGVDGLAAGVVAIVSVVLIIAEVSRPGPNQHEVVVLSAALVGACLGFLVFNFHPARIFMGDSGAEFLGMALGLLSILGVAKLAVGAALLVPLVALAVPIVDSVWAMVRRHRAGISIVTGDRSHVHHRLLDLGLNQRQTCLVYYGETAILGAAALTLFGHRVILLVVAILLLITVATLLSRRLRVGRWYIPVPGGQVIRLIFAERSPPSDP